MYRFLITLILLPQIVSAECSWILWSKSYSISVNEGERGGVWTVEKAFRDTKRVKIQTELPKIPNVERKSYIVDTRGTVISSGKDNSGVFRTFTNEFLCLPDTIDPRVLKR